MRGSLRSPHRHVDGLLIGIEGTDRRGIATFGLRSPYQSRTAERCQAERRTRRADS